MSLFGFQPSCKIGFQKNPNASLPIPAKFDPSLMIGPEELHVPNQLPAFPNGRQTVPSLGFDWSFTKSDENCWGGGQKMVKLGFGPTQSWDEANKEEMETLKRTEEWKRNCREGEKNLPPVSQEAKAELDNFEKTHVFSKIVNESHK